MLGLPHKINTLLTTSHKQKKKQRFESKDCNCWSARLLQVCKRKKCSEPLVFLHYFGRKMRKTSEETTPLSISSLMFWDFEKIDLSPAGCPPFSELVLWKPLPPPLRQQNLPTDFHATHWFFWAWTTCDWSIAFVRNWQLSRRVAAIQSSPAAASCHGSNAASGFPVSAWQT